MRAESDLDLDLDGTPCALLREPGRWSLTLPRALAPVRDDAELHLLEVEDDALLPCRVRCDDDTVRLDLDPAPAHRLWQDLENAGRADRLRALVNAADCARLATRGIAVLLDPGNLAVDRNLRPLLAYRGLLGVMPPAAAHPDDLLRQYQALALATMDARASWRTLVQGAMTLRRGSDYEKAVRRAGSVDELADYLTSLYDETTEDEEARTVRVGRRSHAVVTHAAVWLGVAALGLGAVAGYDTFVRAPFDARMLDADRAFMALDYDGVIETLRPVPPDRLPATQRYALAYSYVQGTNLSDEQRTVIENTLSLSTPRDALSYWVHLGRGSFDEALDLARGLEDVDLILYALTLAQEQVRADTTLSGTARQERLAELQEEYDRYLTARSEALGEDAGDGEGADGGAAGDGGAADGGAAGDGEATEGAGGDGEPADTGATTPASASAGASR